VKNRIPDWGNCWADGENLVATSEVQWPWCPIFMVLPTCDVAGGESDGSWWGSWQK